MKIIYLGVFERPYDTEVYVAKSLEALGHDVVRLPMVSTTIEDVEKHLPCDFLMFSKGYMPDHEKAITYFKKADILTVGWFWDLVWGTLRERQVYDHLAFRADIVFTSDGGHDEKFKEARINHHTLRQGIFGPEAIMYEKEKTHNLIFVGNSVHEQEFRWFHRQELLDWLESNYKSFEWFGKGDGVRNKELNLLYGSTKVVVGDSVYSPNYWSNRIYETLGRGGFLIFPEVPGLEKEFTPYKHYVPYRIGDWDGLREKIDYYLTHDEEREVIRKAGFKHCKENHTYLKRCEELINVVTHEFRSS